MIPRKAYIEKVRPFIGTDVVKVVTGMRRCGKSVFLEQIQEELRKRNPNARIVSLCLDDEKNRRFLPQGALYEHLNAILEEAKDETVHLFLDEVHDVEGWETTVNSLRMRKNADVYVTGSNSKLLSGELATYLTGRHVEIRMTPFSFAEFREAARSSFPGEDDAKLFERYLTFGGMPFLAKIGYESEASRTYLTDLYEAILLKDVVRRRRIRDADLLDRIVRYVLTECGHSFSARNVAAFLKNERRDISVGTVLSYLSACEEAFLVARAPRHDLLGKRILSVDEKFYATDVGLRNAVVGGNLARDIDRLLENVVFFEFLRRGYDVKVGRLRDKEIDFVCEKGNERLYVQVAYLLAGEETRRREFGALEALKTPDPRLLLTMDRLDMGNGAVRHLYIPDFLLANSSR